MVKQKVDLIEIVGKSLPYKENKTRCDVLLLENILCHVSHCAGFRTYPNSKSP